MDGDGPKVIGSQSWSPSRCHLKSRGGRPQEAVGAAPCREDREQGQGAREGRRGPVPISWLGPPGPDDIGSPVLNACEVAHSFSWSSLGRFLSLTTQRIPGEDKSTYRMSSPAYNPVATVQHHSQLPRLQRSVGQHREDYGRQAGYGKCVHKAMGYGL